MFLMSGMVFNSLVPKLSRSPPGRNYAATEILLLQGSSRKWEMKRQLERVDNANMNLLMHAAGG